MKKPTERIAVMVLNWDRRNMLEKTLSSFIHFHSDEDIFENLYWVVLDNGSTDDSREYIDSLSFWDKKIYLEENVGCAGGCSELAYHILEETDREFVLYLENDRICTRADFLDSCIDLFDMTQRHGLPLGQIRLTSGGKNINSITKKPVVWSDVIRFKNDSFKISNMHFALGTSIFRREVCAQIFPCTSEQDAQIRYEQSPFQNAMIQGSGCFEHIGHGEACKAIGGKKRGWPGWKF